MKGRAVGRLTSGGNDVNTLAANVTGNVHYTDANGFDIGKVKNTKGVDTDGNRLRLEVVTGSAGTPSVTPAPLTVPVNSMAAAAAVVSVPGRLHRFPRT